MNTRRGFTMLETILALIVGAVLVGSATLLYNQLKENAGDAAAKQRVVALQGVVEKLITANKSENPAGTALVDAWVSARGLDYRGSPWGGTPLCNGSQGPGQCLGVQNTPVLRDVVVNLQNPGRCYGGPTAVGTGDIGLLTYFHVSPLVRENHIDVFDQSTKLWATTDRYAVAIVNSSGKQFCFVQGPPDVDPSTGLPRGPQDLPLCFPQLSGRVGDDSSSNPFNK